MALFSTALLCTDALPDYYHPNAGDKINVFTIIPAFAIVYVDVEGGGSSRAVTRLKQDRTYRALDPRPFTYYACA
jgi:hypothetical protein